MALRSLFVQCAYRTNTVHYKLNSDIYSLQTTDRRLKQRQIEEQTIWCDSKFFDFAQLCGF